MSVENLRTYIQSHRDQLIDLRHQLHQIPEPGLTLPLTKNMLEPLIHDCDLELYPCEAVTGMMAVLRGGQADTNINKRPIILLRADMDGLPVEEKTGHEWAATNGAMHACGHDMHMSSLVGAMQALASVRNELAGDVVFMFQPGEEGWNGAKYMIDEGLLNVAGRRPDHAYGLHVWAARYPAGFIGTRKGAMMASSDTLSVTITGRGGHGSAPHEVCDPVPVLAEFVTQVQVVIAREFNIFDPVVATCGHITAGRAANVIPDEAYADLTLRAFSPATRHRLQQRLMTLADHIARAHNMTAQCDLHSLYPITINNEDEVDYAHSVVDSIWPGRWQWQEEPMAASEDFSRVLQEIPGCFIGVSAVPAGGDHEKLAFNHSAQAHFDDSVLGDCSTLLATLAYQRIQTSPPVLYTVDSCGDRDR